MFFILFIFLAHGKLTRIFSSAVTSLCWKTDAPCGEKTVDRWVYYTSACRGVNSIFFYDKVTGALQHACSGAKVCLRTWGDNTLIISEVSCNDNPVWYEANTRFTRTSCTYYIIFLYSYKLYYSHG